MDSRGLLGGEVVRYSVTISKKIINFQFRNTYEAEHLYDRHPLWFFWCLDGCQREDYEKKFP